jgi:sporulation protein YlmC with PRC-barrel domain
MVEIGKLNWKKVVTSDGVTIGQLEGAEIDLKNWQVTHVHIGLNDATLKEFGLKKPYLGRVLICLSVDDIQETNGTIMLKRDLQEMKTSKECQEFRTK